MTTVAFRDGVLATDSRGNHSDAGIVKAKKLFRKTIGRREHIIGVAGDLFSAMVFIDWYGTKERPPEALAHLFDEGEDFEALIWTGKKLFEANRLCRLVEIEDKYYAIGSGAPYALAAMDCGKSAAEAIRIACRRDNNSGLPVVAMNSVKK